MLAKHAFNSNVFLIDFTITKCYKYQQFVFNLLMKVCILKTELLNFIYIIVLRFQYCNDIKQLQRNA